MSATNCPSAVARTVPGGAGQRIGDRACRAVHSALGVSFTGQPYDFLADGRRPTADGLMRL